MLVSYGPTLSKNGLSCSRANLACKQSASFNVIDVVNCRYDRLYTTLPVLAAVDQACAMLHLEQAQQPHPVCLKKWCKKALDTGSVLALVGARVRTLKALQTHLHKPCGTRLHAHSLL